MSIEVKCHCCGSDAYDVVYETAPSKAAPIAQGSYKITDHGVAAGVRVVCCRRCGLSFLNPRPQAEEILDNYGNMVDEAYLKEEEGRRASARYILKYLKTVTQGKGTLLDIGCAAGFFLDEARKQGFEVHGIEMSKWAVAHARRELKLEHIHEGKLEDVDLPRNSFDVVVMTDVIEHLLDPKDVLERIRLLLKPNGILCCNTPDINSVMSRILKEKWWGIKPTHLFYFNKKTLSEMLGAVGFSVIKTRSHARSFSLGYWLSNLAAYKPSFKFINNIMTRFPQMAKAMITVDLSDQIEIFARKSRQIKYLDELEFAPDQDLSRVKKKTIVVLPAYNAAKTLSKTLQDIPRDCVDEIILVDDASTDNTVEVARSLGLCVIEHGKNKGYGANQKTCYQEALKRGADIVVMVHPDYQYDPTVIPQLIEPIVKAQADAVFGSRMMKGGALQGGMPAWKYNANILLTALENVVLGIYLTEYHTGFRAYSRKYLTSINLDANDDGFVFDTEIIVQGVLKFMKFEEVPIRTRYFDEASSIKLWPSIVYGLNILKTLFKFILHKKGWRFKQFE